MSAHHDHGHDHDHVHGHHDDGWRGRLKHFFVPHTHDAADSIDDALQSHEAGLRAVKTSLVLLLATALLQGIIVVFSGSVALLADTIHNFSDAFTAVPLWIAFVLSRRPAGRRYTYGYHRAEDLAGLVIVLAIALSALVAGWQAVERIIDPRPLSHSGWVIAAGVVGFIGNEAVALYRIRVGQRIGSAALVADGIHARADGFTSLAVVFGGLGVLLGFPLADPLVGLLICAMILVLLWGTIRSVGRRLMDGVEPELVQRLGHAVGHVPGVDGTERIRLRWLGHQLHGEVVIRVPEGSLSQANRIAAQVQAAAREHLPKLEELSVLTLASPGNRVEG